MINIKSNRKPLQLNSQGFTHDIVAAVLIVTIAVGGTFLLVATHAAPVQPEIYLMAQPAAGVKPPVLARTSGYNGSVRYKIVNALYGQLGVKESPWGSNHIPGNPYQSNNQSWCAYFASWVWQRGRSFPTYANANQIKQWGKANGHWHRQGSYGPHSGDIAVFQQGVHVGIVAVSSHGKIDIIGGNVNNSVAFQTSANGQYQDWPSNFFVRESASGPAYYIDGFVTP